MSISYSKRPYTKVPLTIDDQVVHLRGKGMIWTDEADVKRWLRTVGYYRLGAYWYWYQDLSAHTSGHPRPFKPNTTFEKVVADYVFDRELRLLVAEAIDRVEIELRARWSHLMAVQYGPHAHLDVSAFDRRFDHGRQVQKARVEFDRALKKELFARHYAETYGPPDLPPIWVATELMEFGSLNHWVRFTKDEQLVKKIALDMGLPTNGVLLNVLPLINEIRNACFHHHRLWNRRFVWKIKRIARFDHDLNSRGQHLDDHLFNGLVVLARMVEAQSPSTTWPSRLYRFLKERRTGFELGVMGFPNGWEGKPLWTAAARPAARATDDGARLP